LCEKRKIVSTEQLRERELCGRQMAAFWYPISIMISIQRYHT
jgi:hypothetical protein